MQHGEAQVFGGFFGAQQGFPPVGSHRFVRFDAPEAGVLVAQVAKTGHQQPFVRRRARFVGVAPRVPGGHAGQAELEGDALLQQRRQGLGDQARRWVSAMASSSGASSAVGRPVPTVSGEMLKCTMMLGYIEMKSTSATALCSPISGW